MANPGSSAGATPRPRGWGLYAALIAPAPGWAVYAATRPNPVKFVRANDPESIALGAAALCIVGSTLVMAAVWWWLARRDRTAGLAGAVMRTRIVLLAPLLVALLADSAGFLGMRRPVLILGCALLVASWAPSVPPRVTSRLRRLLGGPRWPLVVLGLATAAAAAGLIHLALLRHAGLHTRAFDLGIYDNTVWQTLHGNFLGCSLIRSGAHTAAHFDPILALVAPLYALAPRAEALIVIQALWVLSSVAPAYLLARHHLGDRTGATLVGLCVLAYPSVHGVILYEFHSLTLLAPLALWLVYALERGRPRTYLVLLALVLLVREDAALFAIGVGIYAVLGTPHRRLGALSIAVAAAYLVAVKTLAMPDASLLMEHAEDAYAYANRYRGFIPEGGGARDGLSTLGTNPAFVVGHVLTREKVMAATAFLLPLGFLPMLAGRRLLLLAYGTAFMFLATHASLYFPLFHYSSVLYPMLFAALPAGMVAARRRLERHGMPTALARRRVYAWLGTCALLGSVTMGAARKNVPFALHTPTPRALSAAATERYAWLAEVVAEIPEDASVSGTNRTTPHISNRARAHLLQQHILTDYLLVHEDDIDGPEQGFLRRHADAYELRAQHGPLRLLARR